MPIKTILSVLGVDQDAADLVRAAEAADQAEADLRAAIVGRVPPAPFGDMTGEAYAEWSLVWEAENARLRRRVTELRKVLADRGLRGDLEPIYCVRGSVAEEIGERASYADVVLAGADLLGDEALVRRVLDGVLFQSPAPVILVPGDADIVLRPKTVLVAWKPGLEAARAVRQAMEWLAGAEEVHVAMVNPEDTESGSGKRPGAAVAAYLASHGVDVTLDVLEADGREVDVVLRERAMNLNADLMVMGAYGHSRLRERIFGGTTSSVIADPGLPVFMAR